jgi:predicted Zn-dependent protease
MGNHIPSNEIYSTALHEVGHMLGISEHSQNVTDVMCSESLVPVISERDVRMLNLISASAPEVTNPTDMTLAQFRNQQEQNH